MRFSDIDKKRYLTTSTATLVYIILCNQLGLKEEYSEDTYKLDKYAGAWVSYPSGEHFTGKIRIRDFSSLYPSIMHQANIYSPVKDNNGWNGGKLFKTVGVYNNKEQGKIEKLLKKWYEDRKIYKKLKDPREYCLKICLNTVYGIVGKASFKHFFNKISASDITALGRQFIKYARKRYTEEGYNVFYSDTDSLYMEDPFGDDIKYEQIAKDIVANIKSSLPFPYEQFELALKRMQLMYGFKGKNKKVNVDLDMKRDYIDKEKGFLKRIIFIAMKMVI